MPKVSVMIPSYNHEKYIAETIDSILKQTFQDFEIVIVDDASTDNTVGEIRKFKDSRIKLFELKKNRGAAYAANRCIQESRSEYIAMLNSDDIFLPNKLGKQLSYMKNNQKTAAVFSYAQIIDEEGNDFTDTNHFYYHIFKQSNRTKYEWLNFFFHNGNALAHPTVLIRKKHYKEFGNYNERLAQLPDLDFWVKLCLKYDIHVIPENLIKFRIRSKNKNMSSERPESQMRHAWELTQILTHYLKISTIKELLRIFPEMKDKYPQLYKELIHYYIAVLALERKWAPYQLFAINTLYEILGNPKIAKFLEEKHGFTYVDFIKLTGTADVMNFFEISQRDAKIKELSIPQK